MPTDIPRWRSPVVARLIVVSLVAFLLRFTALGSSPLFAEEKWTLAQAAGFSFVDLPPVGMVVDSSRLARWTNVAEVLHRIGAFDQPLFILLEHGSIDVFGTSEWALRLLPALFGAISPVLLYCWARRLVDEPEALFAAALLAVHPFHVSLSRYARVYSIAIALLLIGYLFPHRWKERRVFSPTALFLGLQPLTHMLSGFSAIPHLIKLRFVARVPKRQILASVCVGLIILACALPFGLADSILSEHRYSGLAHSGASGLLAFAPEPLAAATAAAVNTLFGLDLTAIGGRTRYALPLLGVLVLAAGLGVREVHGARRVVLVTGAVLPFLVALSLSAYYGHVLALLPRYSVWCLPFLLALLSVGLKRLPAQPMVSALILATYLAIDVATIRVGQQGLMLTRAAQLAACSSEASPISVDDPVDGFVAGAAHGDQVFFRVRPVATGQGPTLPAPETCR